ncbi:MAG TPA: hypothetical protein VFS00_33450, partial [Polyangiaceae bacterium]|nr:hypothetical protein [Polyangiaceae bacterium]
MYPERKTGGRRPMFGALAAAALGAALASAACSGAGEKDDGGGAPPGGEGPSAGVVSKKGRLKFRAGQRLAGDLAEALALPREEVCRELGAYDCAAVHNVVLGGVEPYQSSIYEPLPKRAVPTALAVDRLALSACDRRAALDFADPAAAVVFAALAGDPAMGDAAIEATAASLYGRLLRRDARPDEARALADFGRELRAELGAEAPRRFATLGCF